MTLSRSVRSGPISVCGLGASKPRTSGAAEAAAAPTTIDRNTSRREAIARAPVIQRVRRCERPDKRFLQPVAEGSLRLSERVGPSNARTREQGELSDRRPKPAGIRDVVLGQLKASGQKYALFRDKRTIDFGARTGAIKA